MTIVFLTGGGDDVDPHTAAGAGADLMLAKPFNVQDVKRASRLAASRLGARTAA